MRAGLRWNWETFPEYLDALERLPLGLNVGAHISHAPLRIYAMGERGATDAEPSDDELAVMRLAVARGDARRRARLRHRPHDHAPHAGLGSGARHLRRAARARPRWPARWPRKAPACSSWCRTAAPARTPPASPQEFEWMTPLARDTNRPFSLALIQNLAYPDGWREALALAEAAAARGAHIAPQVAVRSVGVLIGFDIAINAAVAVPRRRRSASACRATTAVRALRDPAVRARLLASVARPQRRHPRRHGDARARLPARRRRRARLRDRRRSAASSRSRAQRGIAPARADARRRSSSTTAATSSSCRSSTPTSTPPARCCSTR